ncbi:hypothetical protein SKAU_G00223280 [Synaphobranchus kaupii]|uniref:Uncharacterized protein n=1 Tax=Synaphobranchus kaupii TaxID=118154 RepID=A0A9Q1FB54_SYNKA|nr:hypothetical protein SKAU_G00223280 [Synaphobranchus kaupii]
MLKKKKKIHLLLNFTFRNTFCIIKIFSFFTFLNANIFRSLLEMQSESIILALSAAQIKFLLCPALIYFLYC